ncbi:MAG TPA: dihydrodipicolinate reductase C-terminal domain-containing protein [Candidatus Cybelea sp.]|nr:dihydrodipicolinate reductase C-terminal domain-containing protein [Candidatus Cybelea sp.]
MNLGLAIVGYGKMGKLIERLAPEHGFEVRAKFHSGNNARAQALSHETLRGVDVAMEFTRSEAAPENIRRLAVLGINTVVGTTGWFEQLPDAREAVEQGKTGLVWAPNFSLGVNLFLQSVGHAAALFARYSEYEAWGWEIHHAAKKDAPSGTLKRAAEEMRAAGYGREMTLSANRAGAHPGTHEIGFDSASDTITLRHTARSREGFAHGALRAAQWLAGKKGFFEFREILGELD